MNNENVWAAIVTFNPDIDRLRMNISAIAEQVEKVLIIDNNSQNIDEFTFNCNNFMIIRLNENRGIGYALNIAMEKALIENKKYLYTLDQDSVSTSDIIDCLLKGFDFKDVALVAPTTRDINLHGIIPLQNNAKSRFEAVQVAITSGSLFDLHILGQIKGHNEELFIDAVDFDICYRIQQNKKIILQAEEVYLLHGLGDLKKKKFLSKTVYTTNHSASRMFYIARNYTYCYKKYSNISQHAKSLKKLLFKLLLKVILFESNKIEKIKSFKKGKKLAKSFKTTK